MRAAGIEVRSFEDGCGEQFGVGKDIGNKEPSLVVGRFAQLRGGYRRLLAGWCERAERDESSTP